MGNSAERRGEERDGEVGERVCNGNGRGGEGEEEKKTTKRVTYLHIVSFEHVKADLCQKNLNIRQSFLQSQE